MNSYQVKLYPQFDITDEKTCVLTASTADLDRDDEIVDVGGIDLANFRKNPIILFGHDMAKPIARALWVKVNSRTRQLIAKIKFADTELSNEVWNLVQGRFLSGVSVGFRPLELREPTAEEKKLHPGLRRIIAKSELYEISIVSVPSNPNALITAVSEKSLNLSETTLKTLNLWGTDERLGEITPPTEAGLTSEESKEVVLISAATMLELQVLAIAANIENDERRRRGLQRNLYQPEGSCKKTRERFAHLGELAERTILATEEIYAVQFLGRV